MLYADLPESTELVRSRREGDLTDAISLAIGPATECIRLAIAANGPSSCRVFMTARGEGVFLDPSCRRPPEIAAELMRYSTPRIGVETARLPEPRPEDTEPGWAIRKIIVNGHPAAVATAVWVERK